MFKSNDNTVEIQGTLVKLDALYESYATILKQAKEQLEGLELSAEDYTVLTRKLSTHSAFNKSVSSATCIELIKQMVTPDEDNALLEEIIARITKRVSDNLQKMLASELASAVDAFISSDYVETEVEKRIAGTKSIQQAISKDVALDMLIKMAFNPDNETK